MCKYRPDSRCYHLCCSLFDCCSGDVGVCPLHLNPFGFMMPRKVGIVLRCLWSKHLHGGS